MIAKTTVYQNDIKWFIELDTIEDMQHLTEALGNMRGIGAALLEAGFATTPTGAEPGSKTETIEGYVVGEREDGQPCVHLYGHSGLEWKLITVWEEDVPKLPFRPNLNDAISGAAPKRQQAESRGWFVAHEMEIVLAPHKWKKKKDSDEPLMVFSHVVGYSAPTQPELPKQQPTPQRNEAMQSADPNESEAQILHALGVKNGSTAPALAALRFVFTSGVDEKHISESVKAMKTYSKSYKELADIQDNGMRRNQARDAALEVYRQELDDVPF